MLIDSLLTQIWIGKRSVPRQNLEKIASCRSHTRVCHITDVMLRPQASRGVTYLQEDGNTALTVIVRNTFESAVLRVMNDDVSRNLNMYSFPKLYPVCSTT